MDDYIKRSKALGELKLDYKDIMYIDKQETAARIREIPSIDIVRCKECKHWQDWGNGDTHCCCLDGGIGSLPDDFCSYGERKDR